MEDCDHSSMTILVADDDADSREMFSNWLVLEGYRVLCASDGDEALSLINSKIVDLALLDVIMPGRKGFSICQVAKSNPETGLIPIILVTGLDDPDDRIDGAGCGADDFLSKPVDKRQLLARVHSLLRMKQFTDDLDNAESVLFSLALSIEAKDPYTGGLFIEVGGKLFAAGIFEGGAAERRANARYWKAKCAGAYPAETWAADFR